MFLISKSVLDFNCNSFCETLTSSFSVFIFASKLAFSVRLLSTIFIICLQYVFELYMDSSEGRLECIYYYDFIFLPNSRIVHEGWPRKKMVKSCLCPECDVSITTPSAMDRHLRSHNGEKPFKCEKCGAALSQKGSVLFSFILFVFNLMLVFSFLIIKRI